jgi:electron transfer flavoprotein alpha subunit
MKDQAYNIIAVLNTIEDKLVQQSLELIAFAEKYNSGDLSRMLLVIPGKSIMNLSESVSEKYGVDTAALEKEELYLPNPEALSYNLSDFINEHKPELVLFTHTVRNCQSAAILSVQLHASSVTAVESFTRENDECMFQRSMFNGKFKENVRLKIAPKIVTVLPGAFIPAEDRIASNNNAVVLQGIPGKAPAPTSASSVHRPEGAREFDVNRYKPLSLSSEADGGVKLEDADVIVSAGRGIGKEENLELIRETASIFRNSAIGASRPVCDNRWLPFNQQVGITGRTVSPKLYLACGISGSQQHIAGMKNSQCIAAINKDPNAAIFSIADYIIIEDIMKFLPLLVKKYHERYGEE